MSKRLSRQWLYAEWCRACFLGGMHGVYSEGPKTAVLLRFMNTPHVAFEETSS